MKEIIDYRENSSLFRLSKQVQMWLNSLSRYETINILQFPEQI